MLEQRGKHTYIPQRASLPPQQQGRPGRREEDRYTTYPQQYRTQRPTTNRPIEGDDEESEYDDVWPTRMPTSARRYQDVTTEEQVIQQGNKRIIIHRGLPPARQTPPQPTQQPQKTHWLVKVGIVMLLMLVGWELVTLLITQYTTTHDDLVYGRPRTFHTFQSVGHNDTSMPSYFTALNLNHRVQIIECPASDCSKAVMYFGAQIIGQGDDLAVVTLTFKDVNGDGKLDMLVHVADQTYVFINDKGRFRPARPDDHVFL